MMSTLDWDDSLAYALWRANQVVQRIVADELAATGATVTQLGILVHLASEGPYSASELARRFRITPQSASTALAELERRGWVQREPHPVNGRVVLHRASSTGESAARDAQQRLQRASQRIAKQLPEGVAEGATAQLRIIDETLGGPR